MIKQKRKELCERCGDKLIIEKNIYDNYYEPICKKCRLILMESTFY